MNEMIARLQADNRSLANQLRLRSEDFYAEEAAREAAEARLAALEKGLRIIDDWCCPLVCPNCADNRETARALLATKETGRD